MSYLPIKEIEKDGYLVKYYNTGELEGHFIATDDSQLHRGSNIVSQYELSGMIKYAHGRVLLGGLGVGLTALLLEQKPEVTEVVAVEYDERVIEAFENNGFKHNIKIIQEDMFIYSDEEGFDCILTDITPTELPNDWLSLHEGLRDKTNTPKNSTIYSMWQWEYLEGDEPLDKFLAARDMPAEIADELEADIPYITDLFNKVLVHIDEKEVKNSWPTNLLATSEDYKSRIGTCRDCPSFRSISQQCKECGCIMPLKARIKAESCPLGKW